MESTKRWSKFVSRCEKNWANIWKIGLSLKPLQGLIYSPLNANRMPKRRCRDQTNHIVISNSVSLPLSLCRVQVQYLYAISFSPHAKARTVRRFPKVSEAIFPSSAVLGKEKDIFQTVRQSTRIQTRLLPRVGLVTCSTAWNARMWVHQLLMPRCFCQSLLGSYWDPIGRWWLILCFVRCNNPPSTT